MRAGLLLLALFGCGMLARDEAVPERPCGAAGPWRPVGEVEVCLGTARAVPSSPEGGAAGGLCVASEAAVCEADGDCGDGERCLCGLCRVVRCETSSRCADGESCIVALGRCARRCDPAEPRGCREGFSCSLGGCVADCRGDADCAHGETCNEGSGHCTAVPCGGDSDCPDGGRCEVQTVAADVSNPDAFVLSGDVGVLAEVRRQGRSVVQRLAWPSTGRLEEGYVVLEPEEAWEGSRVGAPDVLELTDGTRLFYAGGDDAGIGVARLDAGGAFVRAAGGPVLTPDSGWEAGRVGSPGAAEDGEGGILLFYTGGDDAGVGLARGTPGEEVFERVSGEPLLPPAAAAVEGRWTELDRLADPDVSGRTDDGSRRIFFAARGIVRAGEDAGAAVPPDWSIGLALVEPRPSVPLVTFDPFGPVLADRTGVGEESVRDERGASVVRWGNGWRMIWWEPQDGGGSVVRAAVCP
ncbi:MAG: hypothetical protein HY905_24970 [Deltaproteobacteria bacterium]|nr:hypothetical protein [Deltaproteobacteria bacterium]